ncbi:MAG: hypothetical protein QW837_04255 [Conexivisphaerales archaeon]
MLIATRLYLNSPRSRLYLHYMFNSLVKIFFPPLKQFRDMQAGFKVINAQSFNIVKNELIMDDFIFDTNLIYSLIRNGVKVVEYPVAYYHEESGSKFSKSLVKSILLAFLSLVKLRTYYSPIKIILDSKSFLVIQSKIQDFLR